MPAKRIHHRGVCNGDPGKRSIKASIEAQAPKPKSAKGGEDDGLPVPYQWRDRTVSYLMPNGWRIERVKTQEDATEHGTQGKCCVGFNWRTYFDPALKRCTIFAIRTPEGEVKGTINMGYRERFEKARKEGRREAYDGYPDIKEADKPMLIDGEEYYLLEVKGAEHYNTTASKDILAMVKEWYTRNLVVGA